MRYSIYVVLSALFLFLSSCAETIEVMDIFFSDPVEEEVIENELSSCECNEYESLNRVKCFCDDGSAFEYKLEPEEFMLYE